MRTFLEAHGVPASTPIEQKYTSVPCFAYRILLSAKVRDSAAKVPTDAALEAAREGQEANCFDLEEGLQRAQALDTLAAAAETRTLAAAELTQLQTAFVEADRDHSGGLDVDELSAVLKAYLKARGVSRSTKVLQKELLAAMANGDMNHDGELQFEELARLLYGDAAEDERLLKLPPRALPAQVRLAAARAVQREYLYS